MDPNNGERIVMTPKKKTSISTTLKLERKRIQVDNPQITPSKSNGNVNGDTPTPAGNRVHKQSFIAGGSNAGIVVNKQMEQDNDDEPSHLCLEFRVFLRNATTKRYTQERRVISYWFKPDFSVIRQAGAAQDFFTQLVSPTDFPRDYVGFIKKIMKLMQVEYPMIAKIEIEMTQEMEMDCLPIRPRDLRRDSKMGHGTDSGESSRAESAEPPLTSEDVLAAVEEAYPNSLTIDDMAGRFKSEKELVRQMMLELVEKNLVKPVGGPGMPAGMPGTVDTATGAFRRVHNQTEDGDDVTVVKGQMPRGLDARGDKSLHPTIAIITAHYFEKMAVDAVMTNKQTFVRYATVGEANVYTLGDIGKHRVVSTKLPMAGGHSRDALIATGGTTTRLLGTFQAVEQVFLVGVGGAVPHYTDFKRHVRLGDVVMSAPPLDGQRFIYQYCESVTERSLTGKGNGESASSEVQFETKSWCPVDLCLQEIAHSLVEKQRLRNNDITNEEEFQDLEEAAPWLYNYSQALGSLESHTKGENSTKNEATNGDENDKSEEGQSSGGSTSSWCRPPSDLDRLYMSVGNGDVIEVGHPQPKGGDVDPRVRGEPMLHAGPIGAGRRVAFNERLRQDFAARFHGILAYDCELDSVVESIFGNRKDSYMLIRGIADYKDGTTGSGTRGSRISGSGGKDWQQHAALMAAAVLKAVVNEME